MELSKEQYMLVEDYLKSKSFDCVDLKIEVLDHIISDIENLLSKNYTFENAFKIILLKWEKHFKETTSFYFGIQYYESKIVVKKAIKLFKPFFLLYIIAYFLPMIFLRLISVKVSTFFADFTNGFLTSFSLVAIFYVAYIYLEIRKLKVKTTYRFILRTQYLGVVFLVLGALIGNVFDSNNELNPIFTGFVFAGFSVVGIIHYFYKKHLEAVRKFKIY